MSAPYIYEDHLETERLFTRFLTPEDILVWTNFFKDKEAVELFPTFGLNTNEERAKYWIDKTIARYKENRFGLQALIDKNSNEFIGQCGLIEQVVDNETEIEVGYHIFKRYWGQGYAPEASRIFIDYAFKNKITDSVISIIDVRNIKSQRVADKNGLKRVKQTNWSGVDVFIYRIQRKLTDSLNE
jgi:ribosomal-protein-alanine N-acetyltransferase